MTRVYKNRPLERRVWELALNALSRGGPLLHPAWMWALERLAECYEWSGEKPW